MKFIESNLIPNEEIVFRSKIHYFVYEPALLWSMTFLLMMTLKLVGDNALVNILAFFSFVAAIATFVEAFILRHFTEIAITNQRMIVKKGFIKREVFEMPFSKIESVNVNQSIVGRLLDYGTIDVKGIGSGIDNLEMIEHPFVFRKSLYTIVNN